MSRNTVLSAGPLFIIVLISIALLGWFLYSDDGAITETVHVGSEGIRKAEEVKRQLEESSQANP